MSLSVGIVGLPNVGKSTLFNALLKKQVAYAANFPFATIEPNVGVVPVPDARLAKLAEVVKDSEHLSSLPPEVPATIEFTDIAGLIAGAHKGEGLGNKFLAYIREVDAVLHVVRHFENADIIKEGAVDPVNDLETIETELALADYATLEKQKAPINKADKDAQKRWEVVSKLQEALKAGKPARSVELSDNGKVIAKELSLLTAKPILIALNCDENDLVNAAQIEADFAKASGHPVESIVAISAKMEEDLAGLSDEDQREYLSGHNLTSTGLERVVQSAYATLGLISFLTAGEKEVRAWTIRDGMTAPSAAGVIHTDFEAKFIKAETVSFDDFVACGGWKGSKEKGKSRLEGRDYVMKDGDVVDFKIGS